MMILIIMFILIYIIKRLSWLIYTEYNNIDENDLIEQIKLNDENLTDEQINAYFNNSYTPQEYTFFN